MLLTIDIGNTTTKLGVFNDDSLIERLVIPTIRGKSADEIRESIGQNLNHNLDAAIISSVVPELNDAVADLCRQHFNAPPRFVDHNFDFGFAIKCEPPDGVGIDRLVAAYAAVNKIKTPCIICDFGTATTIDAVNKNGEYLGGIITAGMNLLADALHQRTSKLPRIELRKPENAIGNSTVSAIQSGVYFGYIGLVDGLGCGLIGLGHGRHGDGFGRRLDLRGDGLQCLTELLLLLLQRRLLGGGLLLQALGFRFLQFLLRGLLVGRGSA